MRDRLVLVLALAAAACRRGESAPSAPAIPHIAAPVTIDAECDEADWSKRALRADFMADGEPARPSSEIRVLRDDHTLYVALYAADEDIRSSDAFELEIGEVALRITAAGTVTPSIARVAVDRDGTLDDARDNDEEWVVELALPYDVRGPTPIRASRCDVTKDGVRRCGEWHATVE